MSEANGNQDSGNRSLAPFGMSSEDFRKAAHEMVDYIIGYHSSIAKRQTFPDVKPGFMPPLVGKSAPEAAEEWPKVFAELEEVIMKGMTHWQSPGFMAFFPSCASYPALLGDMLSGALGCIGFSWASSPSCTELETVMMDWLAKAFGLPTFYLHEGKGPGGGVIQGSASEATLVTLLSARSKAIREQLIKDESQSVHDIAKRLVAYTSVCSHSSVERAGLPQSEDVSVYASLKVPQDTVYESLAHYHTSQAGSLNLMTDASHGGTYSGVEPMGLFWSMKPFTTNKQPFRYPADSIETPVYSVSVHKGKWQDVKKLRERSPQETNQLFDFALPRAIIARGVKRVIVRDNGLIGTLFLPKGAGPHPGVIVMFGGYPGVREYKGALLASSGFAALVLAYYGTEHLPKYFTNTLDLSYFETAIKFMKQHPDIRSPNGIGLLGLCKGAQLCMAMATYMSDIRCVIAINGSIMAVTGSLKYKDRVWQEYPPNRIQPDETGKVVLHKCYTLPPKSEVPKFDGYFPFEKKRNVSYMIIAGELDQCSPSAYLAEAAEMQLRETNHPDYEVLHYPGAGHILEPPNFPFCFETYQKEYRCVLDFGGELPRHSWAEKDAWERQLKFLTEKLS